MSLYHNTRESTVDENTSFYGIYKLIADSSSAVTTVVNNTADIVAEWIKLQIEFWIKQIKNYGHPNQQEFCAYYPYYQLKK